jgi:hypothetical protein
MGITNLDGSVALGTSQNAVMSCSSTEKGAECQEKGDEEGKQGPKREIVLVRSTYFRSYAGR